MLSLKLFIFNDGLIKFPTKKLTSPSCSCASSPHVLPCALVAETLNFVLVFSLLASDDKWKV